MVKHTMKSGRYRISMATQTSHRGLIAAAVASIVLFGAHRANAQQQDTTRVLDEVMIQDARVSNTAPLTTSTVGREELDEARTAVSVPYMLEMQPSVVAASENGAVGATSLRIRGVDASRINVNINGITLNDPESQSVFWANIPNLGGMAQSMQIQRGVGASTGGSPAFGAAINMQTLNARSEAYGMADFGYGSWNTRQYGVAAGTGIMRNGLSFDVAYSGLTSDGFLRGGQTDQHSLFASASWYGERTLVKLLTIIGQQNTGITWDGASADQLDEDPHYNSAGKFNVDGNTFYYRNATDNYWQRHYQLYLSHLLNDNWSLNAALDYTHGDGYDEYYKKGKSFSDFVLVGAGTSDFITRKQMDNDAYTATASARYAGERLTFSLGDNVLLFNGDHFGNVLWCRDTSAHFDTPHQWYNNHGHKVDNSTYAKATYEFSSRLNAYADLQLREVHYTLTGLADDLFTMDYQKNYLFFNPKAGVNYRLGEQSRTYFVAGISNREPTRSDIKDAIGTGDTIRPETMLDIEWGYQMARSRWSFSANAYAMLYKDQLTPNGEVSSSGYALMENVEKSYRLGIELAGGYQICRKVRAEANLTLSTNKVVDYTFTDFEDGDMAVQSYTKNTDLALSPNIVGAAILTYEPCKDAKLQLTGKYVGKQYADNTSRDVYAIDPYFVMNVKAAYTFHIKQSQLECQLLVNNVLNHQYRLVAWAGDYEWGGYYHDIAYLQQPGINLMGRVIYRF